MRAIRSGSSHLTVMRILLAQIGIVSLVGLLARWFDTEACQAVLVGGLIAVAANGWMILVLFRPCASSSPQSLVLSLYVGELGKYLFVMAFFAMAFKKLEVLGEPRNALLVFLAFALVQAVIWLWPLLDRSQTTSPADANVRATKE